MTTDRTAHLFFAGTEPRAHSLIAPIDTDAARGTAGYGEFVLEHRRDGDSLVMFITRDTDGSAPEAMPVSVSISAALVRALLNRTPEAHS